jgi:ribosomal protein L11 methyltransferase
MDLWETKVEIPAAAAEATELALLELGCEGWSILEDAVGARAWIVGIFESEPEASRRWSELQGTLPSRPLAAPEVRRLPDEDWRNSYRAHFKAWSCGQLHWVPVWERGSFRLPEGHSVLWLDPGMAFGTGNHETTRLCIERLVEFEAGAAAGSQRSGDISVIDAGCGSGILALSACLLGHREVAGFDHDPEAIRVSIENAELNGLAGRARFSTAGLPDGLGGRQWGVVLANIQADILIRHASALVAAVAPGGILAMSGILAAEAGTVRGAFSRAAPGWTTTGRSLGEWCDLCLSRPAGAA